MMSGSADITLIQLDFRDPKEIHFPTSALALGSFVETKGFTAQIFDFNYQRLFNNVPFESSVNFIPLSSKSLYGISIYHGQLLAAMKVAKFLRKRQPKSKIIFGGPGIFGIENEVMKRFNRLVDFLVVGEGELTLIDILEGSGIELSGNLSTIKGLVWFNKDTNECVVNSKRELINDIESLPYLNYLLIPVSNYWNFSKKKTLPIIAGAGCPFDCTFCSTSKFWGRNFRLKKPERLFNEMKASSQKFDVKTFFFIHDNIIPNKKYAIEFLQYFIDNNSEFYWSGAIRVDTLTSDMITLLEKAQCCQLSIGIESGSETIQKSIKKRLNLENIYQTLFAFENSPIQIVASFIADFPDETESDLEATLRMMFRLGAGGSFNLQLNPIIYLPSTDIYQVKEKFKRRIPRDLCDFVNIILSKFPKTLYTYISISTKSIYKVLQDIHRCSNLHNTEYKDETKLFNLLTTYLSTNMKNNYLFSILKLEYSMATPWYIPREEEIEPVKNIFQPINHKAYKLVELLFDFEELESSIRENVPIKDTVIQSRDYLITYQDNTIELTQISSNLLAILRDIRSNWSILKNLLIYNIFSGINIMGKLFTLTPEELKIIREKELFYREKS